MQGVIDKLKALFERFFGLGSAAFTLEEKNPVVYDLTQPPLDIAAEPVADYSYQSTPEEPSRCYQHRKRPE